MLDNSFVIVGLILAALIVIANGMLASIEQHILLNRIDKNLKSVLKQLANNNGNTNNTQDQETNNKNIIG
jgi:hypothetical protein